MLPAAGRCNLWCLVTPQVASPSLSFHLWWKLQTGIPSQLWCVYWFQPGRQTHIHLLRGLFVWKGCDVSVVTAQQKLSELGSSGGPSAWDVKKEFRQRKLSSSLPAPLFLSARETIRPTVREVIVLGCRGLIHHAVVCRLILGLLAVSPLKMGTSQAGLRIPAWVIHGGGANTAHICVCELCGPEQAEKC